LQKRCILIEQKEHEEPIFNLMIKRRVPEMRKILSTGFVIIFMINVSGLIAQVDIPDEFRSDIKLMMEKTKALEIGTQFGAMMLHQINSVMYKNGTVIPDTILNVLENETISLMYEEAQKEDGLMSRMVPIYAKYFTHEEIKELIRFYDTAIGKKTIEVMPALMQEGMMIGQIWGQSLAPQILERIIKRLEEFGIDASPLKEI
jgi:hypothetical protein